jgi:hypothetical protein
MQQFGPPKSEAGQRSAEGADEWSNSPLIPNILRHCRHACISASCPRATMRRSKYRRVHMSRALATQQKGPSDCVASATYLPCSVEMYSIT